jgi:hypothetical protein
MAGSYAVPAMDYYFGFADFRAQAVVVGQKPLPQTLSHPEDLFRSHEFTSNCSVVIH